MNFNLKPVDIVAALPMPHLKKIQSREERIEQIEEVGAQYRFPRPPRGKLNVELAGARGEFVHVSETRSFLRG